MFATFFMSTGRCGTQWFSGGLKMHYADLVEARHEPIVFEYYPRRLASGTPLEDLPTKDLIGRHLDGIQRTIDGTDDELARKYVETGWPSYGAMPYLLEKFSGRIKIVHLVRHPITTASSLTSLNYYGRGRDILLEKALRTPMDDGVAFPMSADEWAGLSQFERCLFHWGEMNRFALNVSEKYDVPWLRIRFEDVFGPDDSALHELLDFLELPSREGLSAERTHRKDRFHFKSYEDWSPTDIHKYPFLVELSETFGYNVDAVDNEEIIQRYKAGADEVLPTATDLGGSYQKKRNDLCYCGSGKRFKHCHGA